MTHADAELPQDLEDELFRIHFDVAATERPAALRRLCDENAPFAAALRAQYEDLQRSERLLGAAHRELDAAVDRHAVAGFEIERVLGEGGFGTVYLALQREPVERHVALKILHAHRADAVALRRFEDERRLLARLKHSCIAQVYDAGVSADGKPFFAMEYVEGLPITDWCRRRALDLDGRLRLFQRVCGGIHHAHQREVVHRDLKPSNVLVTEQDGAPMPKVIDFGIAKHLARGGATHDLTVEGARVGTPGYMSPEQAAGDPVGSGTDVYSLGVLLCELLVGEPLHPAASFAGKSFSEIARMLSAPPARRPSERLPAAVRAREPALVRRLQVDLDWIVLRATAASPDERYASVAALADDVERHLAGEPVLARQHATWYLVSKFVRRHRVAVSITASVAVLLLVAVGVLTWSLDVVGEARRQAERERDAARASDAAARMAVAQFAVESGDVRTGEAYLDGVAADRRGWEWRHLASRLDDSVACHDLGEVYLEVEWLDDERVVLFPFRGDIEVLRVDTGEVEGALADWTGIMRRAEVDVASRAALVAGDHGLGLWDLDTRERVRDLGRFPGEVFALAWSEDRRAAAVGGRGKWLHLVDVSGDAPRSVLPAGQDVTAVAFLGADQLVIGSPTGTIRRVRRATGEVLAELEGHTDVVERFLVDEARGQLYSASIDGSVRAWSLADDAPRAHMFCNVRMRRLKLSADGALLFACGGHVDARLQAWDTTTFQLRGLYRGHRAGVAACSVSPDGARLASTSGDRSLRLWSTTPPQSAQVLEAGRDARVLSADPAGARFATAALDGVVRVWNAGSLALEMDLQTKGSFTGSALHGDVLYVAGATLRALAIPTGDLLAEGETHGRRVESMAVSPDGRWLVGGHGARLLVWHLPELALLHDLELPVGSAPLLWEQQPGRFAVGCEDMTVRWLDAASGAVVDERRFGAAATSVRSLARAAGVLAVGGGGVVFLELADGVREVEVANNCLAFSPDGRRFATGAAAHQVTCFDAATGDQLLVFRDLTYSVEGVRWVAGGQLLVALAHRWEAPSYVYCWRAPAMDGLPREKSGR